MGCPDPERGDTCAGGLADTSQHTGPEHGLPAGIEGEVERQRHSEALRDVVDEQCQENSQTESGACVIGRECNEALRELVQGYGKGGLQTDGEEGILRDMVVVLARERRLLESLESGGRHRTGAFGRQITTIRLRWSMWLVHCRSNRLRIEVVRVLSLRAGVWRGAEPAV